MKAYNLALLLWTDTVVCHHFAWAYISPDGSTNDPLFNLFLYIGRVETKSVNLFHPHSGGMPPTIGCRGQRVLPVAFSPPESHSNFWGFFLAWAPLTVICIYIITSTIQMICAILLE